MILEILLVFLLIGGLVATVLSLFIRGDRGKSEPAEAAAIDVDNPQRDI